VNFHYSVAVQFSHISINWRGQPLTTLDLVVRLIGATKTENGLVLRADLDQGKYRSV